MLQKTQTLSAVHTSFYARRTAAKGTYRIKNAGFWGTTLDLSHPQRASGPKRVTKDSVLLALSTRGMLMTYSLTAGLPTFLPRSPGLYFLLLVCKCLCFLMSCFPESTCTAATILCKLKMCERTLHSESSFIPVACKNVRRGCIVRIAPCERSHFVPWKLV